MSLVDAVARSLLEGLTTVLPLSDSGHRLAARIWLGETRGLAELARLAEIGCLVGLLLAVRGRLAEALSEGIRGIAKPTVLTTTSGGRDATALVVAAVVAGGVEVPVRFVVAPFDDVPLVVGAGLLFTAAGLLSTLFAPSPKRSAPSPLGAMLVGLAHGLAVVPGASRIGSAFVVMRWMGMAGVNAAEMAMMITLPVLGFRAAMAFFRGQPFAPFELGEVVLVVVVSFLAATLAAGWWRHLAARSRTAWLSLWLVTLSLAILAYGRALPRPTDYLPLGSGRGSDPSAR
ncbi:MAG: undecaprenyl-diphosphate phosphatase [Polyangiaceae bacterium]